MEKTIEVPMGIRMPVSDVLFHHPVEAQSSGQGASRLRRAERAEAGGEVTMVSIGNLGVDRVNVGNRRVVSTGEGPAE